MKCGAGPGDVPTDAATADGRLFHDAKTGYYAYIWNTTRSMAGTCRQMTVRFRDGTTAPLLFEFVR